MRLLNVETYELEEFRDDFKFEAALQQCAIISHRWGDFEVSLQKFTERMKEPQQRRLFGSPGKVTPEYEGEAEGFLKIARACWMAKTFTSKDQDQDQEVVRKKSALKYIWIDTCCINKQDEQETRHAINSMFRWYSLAKVCFAYLPDASTGQDGFRRFQKLIKEEDTGKIVQQRVGSVEDSSYFTRGWTLQELLAPKKSISITVTGDSLEQGMKKHFVLASIQQPALNLST